MAIVAPDISEVTLLKLLVNKQSNGNLVLRLFTNNIIPSDDTVAPGTGSGSTAGPVECTAAGYAAVTLTGSTWTVATATGTSTAQYGSAVTFTMTEAVSVYGYYLTTGGGDMVWIERFSGAPFTLPSDGGDITITPKLTLA
jgi:hypothetical protein